MADVQILKLYMMNTGIFITIDVKAFHYTRAILDVMLNKVPTNSETVSIYKKIPTLSECHIPSSLQAMLDACSVPWRAGFKRKAKSVDETVLVKPQSQWKLEKKVSTINEDTNENTVIDVRIDDDANKEDSSRSYNPP